MEMRGQALLHLNSSTETALHNYKPGGTGILVLGSLASSHNINIPSMPTTYERIGKYSISPTTKNLATIRETPTPS